jgi:hypothetical protein
MIGSPSWLKNNASPPPPDLVVGRSGKDPCTATKSLSAAMPSCLWHAVGTSTSSAQTPDPDITTRQPQPGYSHDQRSSLSRSQVANVAASEKHAARLCRDAGCSRQPSNAKRSMSGCRAILRRLLAHELALSDTKPSSHGLIRDRPMSRCQPSQSEPVPRLPRDTADYGIGRTGGRLPECAHILEQSLFRACVPLTCCRTRGNIRIEGELKSRHD